MAKSKFLLVTFNFEGRTTPKDELSELFNKALDWVNYAPNCYILYTTTDKEDWYQRIRKRVHDNDSIFIIEFDPAKRSGYLPRRVWDWLQKDR